MVLPPIPAFGMSSFDAAALDIFSPTRVSPLYHSFGSSCPDLSTSFSSVDSDKTDFGIDNFWKSSFTADIPQHSPLRTVEITNPDKPRLQPLKLFISPRYRRRARQQQQYARADVKHPIALPSFQISCEEGPQRGYTAASSDSVDGEGDETPTVTPRCSRPASPLLTPSTARPTFRKAPVSPTMLAVVN